MKLSCKKHFFGRGPLFSFFCFSCFFFSFSFSFSNFFHVFFFFLFSLCFSFLHFFLYFSFDFLSKNVSSFFILFLFFLFSSAQNLWWHSRIPWGKCTFWAGSICFVLARRHFSLLNGAHSGEKHVESRIWGAAGGSSHTFAPESPDWCPRWDGWRTSVKSLLSSLFSLFSLSRSPRRSLPGPSRAISLFFLWNDAHSVKVCSSESKATPSCHSCSHLGCTGPSQQCGRDCCRARRFLHSLMTCTSFARHTGCWRCIESWRRNCRTTHRSLCIMGRLKCGTELVFHLRGLTSSQELPEEWIQKPLCGVGTRPCQGVSKGSKSSGFQLVSQSLCSISWNGKRKNILFCSNASRRWRIHRQHGCCCWCALPPGRTTGWGVCDLTSQKRSRIVMMIASGSVFARFCKSLQIIMWPESQLRFRFSVGGMGLPYSKQVEGGRSLGKLGWLPPYGARASPHSGSDHGARDGQGPMPVRSPLGQCWGIAPLLPEPIPQNPASPSLGGSTKPHGVSSSTTPYTGQNCQTLSELWWGQSTDHWLQPRWRRSPRTGWLGSRLNPSVFSCCVGSDYPFPWPHAPADVAANSILLAIIEQRAVWRGFWGEEGFHLSKQQHRCAEKQGREWGPTLSSATWIWKGSTCSMDADWKSSRTAWRCGMGHNSLDTTLVSPLHRDGTARRTAADRNGAPLKQARRLKESTYPELSGEGGRARLVVLAAEVGGRWSEETAQFLRALAKAHAQTAPLILQNRVKAAWLRRWSNVLALPGLSHCPSWTSTRVLGRGLRYLRCMRFWGTIGLREVVFLACCCAWSGFCFSHTFAKKKKSSPNLFSLLISVL